MLFATLGLQPQSKVSSKRCYLAEDKPTSSELLVVEPDEKLLSGYLSCFCRATDFDLEAAMSVLDYFDQVSSFSPGDVLMEPMLIDDDGTNTLDSVNVAIGRLNSN